MKELLSIHNTAKHDKAGESWKELLNKETHTYRTVHGFKTLLLSIKYHKYTNNVSVCKEKNLRRRS